MVLKLEHSTSGGQTRTAGDTSTLLESDRSNLSGWKYVYVMRDCYLGKLDLSCTWGRYRISRLA